MNKPGSRNYRPIYENDPAAADLSSFDTKKGHSTLNHHLFYYSNNNTNDITTITSTNNAPQQAPLPYCNSTLTSPKASEEHPINESLSHYMNLPIEADLAALSFARALVYPPSSNQQVMNPIHIHAALGPSSFETPMYIATTTTSVAAVAATPPGITTTTTMDETVQGTYYGTFDTPYPAATLQSFQDPQFVPADQQQPPPYPGLGSPPPPMWAPQSHEAAVRALFNNSLNTTTPQNQLQPHSQQQQQQQHYYPHTLHYTHHLHQYQHRELSASESPHFLSDPSFSPPPPSLMTSPFTEVDDSASSQGTSSDEEDEEVKAEGPSFPSSPTKAPTYRRKTTTTNKRHAPITAATPKSAPVPKHPKCPNPVKSNKVNKTNANATAKPPGKLHQCEECGRLFTRACNLQSHQTTHLRQKPYPCPDCCLAFARVYDMKRHHRIHSNVRPYQCTACPEAFKRIEARERHYLAHHGYQSHGV